MTKKLVLLVDDDPDFVAIVKNKLERLNCAVEVAYNGIEGLKKLKQKKPDLLVLDVMMPEKDGFQVCKEVKTDPEYEDIPVIMLTAVADHIPDTTYTQYDAMNMEAEDYIPKGADCTEKVVASARELLEL